MISITGIKSPDGINALDMLRDTVRANGGKLVVELTREPWAMEPLPGFTKKHYRRFEDGRAVIEIREELP